MNIVWQKSFNVNVIEIDEQYRLLVCQYNDLLKMVKRGACVEEVRISVENLTLSSRSCFATEEMYFNKLGFSEPGAFQKSQSDCFERLNLFSQSYDAKQPLINLAHIAGIGSAILHHVAGSHAQFNDYMKENRLRHFMNAQG